MPSAAPYSPPDRFSLVSVVALVACCMSPAVSQGTPLPDGRLVIAQFIAATGGTAVHTAIHNRVTRATISIPGHDGAMLVYEAEPNLRLSEERFDVGTMQEGADGTIAWSVLSTRGVSIRQGDALTVDLRHADFDLQLHWQRYFTSAECVGVDQVNDRPAYKVVMKPVSGPAETWYFDTKSKLLIRSVVEIRSASGTILSTIDGDDFRAVDGLLMPFHATSTVRIGTGNAIATTTFSMTLIDVKQNVAIEPGRFDRPQAVKDKLAGMAAAQPDSAASQGSPPAPAKAAATPGVDGK